MSYLVDFKYINKDLEINENIKIRVFEYEFFVDCKNRIVEKNLIDFLENLDIELIKLNSMKLKQILTEEFRI